MGKRKHTSSQSEYKLLSSTDTISATITRSTSRKQQAQPSFTEEHLLVKRSSLNLSNEPVPTTSTATLQDLPAELLEEIVSYLSVRDVVLLGETCGYLHHMCNAQRIWRNLCEKICPRLKEATDWRRSTILNYTKGMYIHTFACRQRVCGNTVAPVISNGFQRFVVTKNNVFILDYTLLPPQYSGNL
ncbi:F-box only protein 24-like [Mixophyes fleayi]|uniref:F-box only protein 24-like n=1 Tax=Mixophyes fleayi TaxID=3061075 RepID=UPI003F4DCC7E